MADVFGRTRLRPGSARVHRAEIVPELRAEHQNREGGPSDVKGDEDLQVTTA